ncbi:septum site-determining protein Ssd [Rhodococcoides corynebacterioides]|uniref:septum site-determining protein Ssd n=1 Tax=Rhodococcoides corynebacterioides TaxID=53972 RepID=UPI003F815C1F
MTSPEYPSSTDPAVTDAAVTVVVDDPVLSDRVRRVVAAAGREVVVRTTIPDRAGWLGATTVVLSESAAADAVRRRHPRRPGVVLVSDGAPTVTAWQSAATLGTPHVLDLPAREADLMTLIAAAPGNDAHGAVVTVIGGCGGAGASVFATALALTSARSALTVLLDADPCGGGLDLAAGVDDRPGLRWPDLVVGGRVDARALHDALPGRDRLAVLSTARGRASAIDPDSVTAVLAAARRAGELAVCDVPRSAGPEHRAAVEASDLVTVVVPATVRGSWAARAVVADLRSRTTDIGLVVRGPAPGGLRADDVERTAGAPVLATMRPERRLASALEHGGLVLRPRSPLAAAASAVLAVLDGPS